MTRRLQITSSECRIAAAHNYSKVKMEIGKLGEVPSRELIGRRLLRSVFSALIYPNQYHNPLTEAERRLARDLLQVINDLDSEDRKSLYRVVTGHVLATLYHFTTGETDPVQWVPVDAVHSGEDASPNK